MLGKARRNVVERRLTHVAARREMVARNRGFPDASFDTVVAMDLVSVLPEPERVIREMEQVCKAGVRSRSSTASGGTRGALGVAEKTAAPCVDWIGWHPDRPVDRALGEKSLQPEERRPLPPCGTLPCLRRRKREAG